MEYVTDAKVTSARVARLLFLWLLLLFFGSTAPSLAQTSETALSDSDLVITSPRRSNLTRQITFGLYESRETLAGIETLAAPPEEELATETEVIRNVTDPEHPLKDLYAYSPKNALLNTQFRPFDATLSLDLTPAAASNPVGTDHTVTATVTDNLGNPLPGWTVPFIVSGAHSAAGSDTTDAVGAATFTYNGTAVGFDTITAWVDLDNDGVQDPIEPYDTAIKMWEALPPASLDLTPPTATNPVDTQHTVTATVRDAGSDPMSDQIVEFVASGANSAGGSDTTDVLGVATFTYTGTVAGDDTITAWVDLDDDGVQDPAEPFDTATTTWELPLAITLGRFDAIGQTDQILLEWETLSEIDNEGFILWRGEALTGPYTRLNSGLIPAQGTVDSGASYDYTDSAVVKGVTYYYRLEDVDIHGDSSIHGPVSATPSSVWRIYFPLYVVGW